MDTATALNQNPALVIGLQAAVPLLMLELDRLDPELREHTRMRWAADAVNEVASKGDALQYGGKRGEAAKTFNALAKGLAAGSYQPGGITAFGQHWCADHQQCLDADAQVAARPTLLDANPDDEPDEEPTYMGRPVTDLPAADELL